jgi:hypothetical protein
MRRLSGLVILSIEKKMLIKPNNEKLFSNFAFLFQKTIKRDFKFKKIIILKVKLILFN